MASAGQYAQRRSVFALKAFKRLDPYPVREANYRRAFADWEREHPAYTYDERQRIERKLRKEHKV